jgi:hypothetical protein
MKLPDVPSDRIWTREVAKLLNWILKEHSDGIKKVNFYGWDFKNDSAYLIISKFQDGLKDYEINYIEVPRQNSFVSYDWQNYELSGTKLRQALREKNYDLAKKFCDLEMFDSILEKFKD